MKTPLHIVIAICSAAILAAAVVELYDVSFTPTRERFASGDSIVIRRVQATSSDLKIGDTVLVHGTYTLRSQSSARLGLSLTTKGPGGPKPVSPRAWSKIDKGSGTFMLEYIVHSPGSLHVSFYPSSAGSSFGGVYFRTVEP